MKFSSDLASIHAYLCGDGYVITSYNKKYKYHHIGLRNTNIVLLKDFQNKFAKVFGLTPIITKDVDRCRIGNKELTLKLLKEFGSFYSVNWKLPKFSKKHLKSWLRSYFDCDGSVGFIKAKDRKIALESINHSGIKQIQRVLSHYFGINSTVKLRKNRNIWSLTICGKDDLEKFQKYIGFLHPKKSQKLTEALNSYVDYNWLIPDNKQELIKFLIQKGRMSYTRNEVRFNSIIKQNLTHLQNRLAKFNIKSRVLGPWTNPYGSIWYCLAFNLRDYNKFVGGEK